MAKRWSDSIHERNYHLMDFVDLEFECFEMDFNRRGFLCTLSLPNQVTLAPACTDHDCKNNSGCKNKIFRVHKSQMGVCYSKMHGCKNIPLVRSIFSWNERSSYMRAPVHFKF